MKRVTVCCLALILLFTTEMPAAVITVGTWELEEDMADQQIEIFVSGGESVQGIEFFLQVADGGPEAGGAIDGPAITNVDILTGTLFDGNNTGQTGGGSLVPQFWQSGTTTNSGSVPANGLLATATISTVGFFSTDTIHTWGLLMKDTLMGSSGFPGVDTIVENGAITLKNGGGPVVPEPSSLLIFFLGLTGMVILRRWCKWLE